MNCHDVDRWLDAGSPEPDAARVEAHATACPRCAGALRAAREVEALLAEPVPVAAPAGFTAAVVARLSAPVPAVAAAIPPLRLGTAMPWWLRAAAEPPAVLAFAIAAMVVWMGDRLPAAGAAGLLVAGRWASELGVSVAATPAGALLAEAPVRSGLLIVSFAILTLAAAPLYGWTARLLATPPAPLPR